MNKFLTHYETWAGDLLLPEKLVDYFMRRYNLNSLESCLGLWAFEDFNTYITKDKSLAILVKSRFRRLNPILASMEFLSTKELMSLWVVEHIEKDLHVKNDNYRKSPDTIRDTIKDCVAKGLTYADIGAYYLEKRFTIDERKRNS